MNISLNTELAYEYNLNSNEVFILASIAEEISKATDKYCTIKDGKLYMWLTREQILQNIKFINITQHTLSNIMRNLKKKNMVDYVTHPEMNGSKTFYILTNKACNILPMTIGGKL